MKTNLYAVLLSAPLSLGGLAGALAQDYPSQAIEIIVPYSAGGGGDTVARIVAEKLSVALDQQINVVNRPGAGGEIGIAEIASSSPDGYTLGIFGYPDNFVLEQTRDTSFSFGDLEYLARFDSMPMGIFSNPQSELATFEDVQSQAEASPGELIVGYSGALGLLNILAMAAELNVTVTPLAYSGGGELMNALLGSHIDMASTSSLSHDPIVDAGGTPVGFAAPERMSMFPDVATYGEQGLPLDLGVSRVIVAPAGISDEVREVLMRALDDISTNEEMIANFTAANIPYAYLGEEDLAPVLEQSNTLFGGIIEANIDEFTGQ